MIKKVFSKNLFYVTFWQQKVTKNCRSKKGSAAAKQGLMGKGYFITKFSADRLSALKLVSLCLSSGRRFLLIAEGWGDASSKARTRFKCLSSGRRFLEGTEKGNTVLSLRDRNDDKKALY